MTETGTKKGESQKFETGPSWTLDQHPFYKIASVSIGRNEDGLEIGRCCRWHPDVPTVGMESSPVISAGVIPNGSFLKTRLRILCPKETKQLPDTGPPTLRTTYTL